MGTLPLEARKLIKHGNISVIQELIFSQKGFVHVLDKYGRTGLFYATLYEHIDMVKLFIENNADLNKQDDFGMSPLHMSSCIDQSEITEMLCSYGANINIQDARLITPLHIASSSQIVEVLCDFNANTAIKDIHGKTALHNLILNQNYMGVAYLLKNNTSIINDKDENGQTALHYAAKSFPVSQNIVDILFQAGANAYSRDKHNLTPADYIKNSVDRQNFLRLVNN